MKLGMEVVLSRVHIVLVEDPARSPSLKRGRAPSQFSFHIYCAQMAGCIKMPLSTEIGIGPSDNVLDGDPALPPQSGTTPSFPPMSTVAKWLDGSR